jgi:fibronectin-binding autotransporter adhesin
MIFRRHFPLTISLALFASVQGWAQTWNLTGGGNWNVNGNWSSGTFPDGVGATALLGTNITANSTISLGQNVTVGSITFNDNNNYLVTNNTLTLAQGGGALILVTNSGGNGAHNLRSAVVFSNDVTVSQWSSGTFTLGGARSGSGNLIKEGTGTLLLTNSSSVVGEVRINDGRLTYGAGNPIVGGSLVKVGDGTGTAGSATLFLDASTGGTFALDVEVASDGLLWQGNNRLVRIESLSGVGETRLNTAVGNGFDFNGNGASNNSTYSGIVTGGIQVANMDRASGSRINKTGSSTLTLTASNSFVARTFIADGTLVAANDYALGLGTAMSNATYVSGFGNLGLISNVVVSEPLFLNSRGSELGAVHSLAGSNRLTGPISMGWSGGSLVATNGSVGAAAGSVLVITSAITGTNASSGMFKLGQGTVILQGASTYLGATVAEAGTLRLAAVSNALSGNLQILTNATVTLAAANQIADTSAVTNSGGLIELGANSDTVASFSMSGGSINGSGTLTAATYALTGGTVNANLGGGALTKTGSGTATIAAGRTASASTYDVTGGTLVVNGTFTGVTTASTAGTIAGTGTVGTLNINGGGVLSPGNSAGTLTATNGAAWSQGGSYDWEIFSLTDNPGASWDLLDVTAGTLNLTGITTAGGFTINLITLQGDNLTPGALTGFDPSSNYNNWLIARAPAITGFNAANFNLATGGFVGAAGTFSISQRAIPGGQGIYLSYNSAIPEPGTWLTAGLLAVAALFHLQRRRRRS